MARYVVLDATAPSATNTAMIIGDHTYGWQHITILFGGQGTELYIGKYCSIAEDVTVMLHGNHHVNWISTYPFNVIAWPSLGAIADQNSSKGNIVIGNDVWLGREVLIMSGVTIADGAVIAARSVVTKPVGPYEIWAGNPAQIKRKRFMQADIDWLCQLKWWDWPDAKVHAAAHILMSDNLAALRSYADMHR